MRTIELLGLFGASHDPLELLRDARLVQNGALRLGRQQIGVRQPVPATARGRGCKCRNGGDRRGVRIGPHLSSSMLDRFGLYGSTALILRWRRSRPMVPVLTATRPVPHRSSLRHVLFAGWLQGGSTADIAALDYASSCSSSSSLSLCLLSRPLRRPGRRGAHRGGHVRSMTSSPPCAFSRLISALRVAAAPQQQHPPNTLHCATGRRRERRRGPGGSGGRRGRRGRRRGRQEEDDEDEERTTVS